MAKTILKKLKDYVPLTELDYNPNEGLDDGVKFIAFKQFQTLYNPNPKRNSQKNMSHKGKLYPLYVGGKSKTGAKDGIELGKWYRCGQGELLGCFNEAGEPLLDENGNQKIKVKSNGLGGSLSYRPGWHIGSDPLTRHIGVIPERDEDGNVVYDENGYPKHASKDFVDAHKERYIGHEANSNYDFSAAQNVWAVVEFSGHKVESDVPGNGFKNFRTNDDGSDSEEFKNHYYPFKTNTNANKEEEWIIADAIKVICVLNDEEVRELVGDEAQTRFHPDGSNRNKFTADFEQFKDFDVNKDIEEFRKYTKFGRAPIMESIYNDSIKYRLFEEIYKETKNPKHKA